MGDKLSFHGGNECLDCVIIVILMNCRLSNMFMTGALKFTQELTSYLMSFQ